MSKNRVTNKNIFIFWVVFSVVATFLAATLFVIGYWFVLNFFGHGVFFANYDLFPLSWDFYLYNIAMWGCFSIVLNIIRIVLNLRIVKKYSGFFSWLLIFFSFGIGFYFLYLSEMAK